jgi:F-type H+-transporting ATPase subunit a
MHSVALDLNVNELFFYDGFLFKGTPFEMNRVAFLMVVASLACIAFFFFASRKGSLVPKGIQNLGETAYLFVRNNIAIDVIGPEGAKYADYLAALFYFIFFMNLLEIVPGVNFPVTSRMAIPALLAVLTWVIFNFLGFKHQGFGYITSTLFPPGVPKAIYLILTPIELFSVFIIRPLTLAIRLLANMMAGHVLLTIFFLFTDGFLLTDFKPVTAPLGVLTGVVAAGLIIFELLVISIQAYIFTMLTAFYIAESIHGHGEEDPSIDTHNLHAQHETEGVATAA